MNKMKFGPVLPLLLALSLLLSSCSFVYVTKYAEGTRVPMEALKPSESGEAQTSENGLLEEPESTADRARARLEDMPAFNFRDQSFIIVTTSAMTFASDGDDYYDRVLLQRDSVVEEKYNIDIITVFTDAGLIEAELRNAMLSDTYYADMISVPEYRIGRLATEGLIMNLRSLPFYSTEYSFSHNSGASAAGNAIYADVGAASRDFSKIYSVFFNRDAAKKLDLDLEGAVKNGSWTWELFDLAAKSATERLGITGQGSPLMGNEYTDVVFNSSGEKLIDNTLGKMPEVKFNSQNVEDLVALSCELIYGNFSAYKPSAGATEADFMTLFGEGGLFMAIMPLSRMGELSAMNINWGVLPIPKLSEAQEKYCGYTEATANVIAVPSENNKFEMTGVIINALNASSYEMLSEEYKTNCLYNYFRDSRALICMDEILSSITFDFTYLYASGADLLANATYGAVRAARTSATDYATSIINSKKDAANDQLAELFSPKSVADDEPLPPYIPDTEEGEDSETRDPEIPDMTDTEAPEDSEIPEDSELPESEEAVPDETGTDTEI